MKDGHASDGSDIVGAVAVLSDAATGLWGGERPEAHLVLGSGLSRLASRVEDAVAVPFAEIPGFPTAGVAGHAGEFILGHLAGRRVLVQAGRFHFYEGHAAATVVAPVRIAASIGSPVTILTNAAGGISRGMKPGDIMLIDDHVNLMGRHPLTGPVRPGEGRFPDMSAPYDPGLQELAVDVALDEGIELRRGVYAGMLGPNYETPAEIRMLAGLGADAVGMSTVPEAIVARARGVRVMGFSLITNQAAGLGGVLDHEEVIEVGQIAGKRLGKLIEEVLLRLR